MASFDFGSNLAVAAQDNRGIYPGQMGQMQPAGARSRTAIALATNIGTALGGIGKFRGAGQLDAFRARRMQSRARMDRVDWRQEQEITALADLLEDVITVSDEGFDHIENEIKAVTSAVNGTKDAVTALSGSVALMGDSLRGRTSLLASALSTTIAKIVMLDSDMPKSKREEVAKRILAEGRDLAQGRRGFNETVSNWLRESDSIGNKVKANMWGLILAAVTTYVSNTRGSIVDAPDARLAALFAAAGTALDGSGDLSNVLTGLVPALELVGPYLSMPYGAQVTVESSALTITDKATLVDVTGKIKPYVITPTKTPVVALPVLAWVARKNPSTPTTASPAISLPLAVAASSPSVEFGKDLKVTYTSDWLLDGTPNIEVTVRFQPLFRVGDPSSLSHRIVQAPWVEATAKSLPAPQPG